VLVPPVSAQIPENQALRTVSNTAKPRAPPPNAPRALPIARNAEQALDFEIDRFLYRPGEILWFQRGLSWGLAMVKARHLFTDHLRARPQYVCQPLSYPEDQSTKAVVVKDEAMLRPWLSWSPPLKTHASLQKLVSFKDVDWQAVVAGKYGSGNAEVDASIFICQDIDLSYTLIEQIPHNTPRPFEARWNGVFYGGEKLWLGEAVRIYEDCLRNSGFVNSDGARLILILHQIISSPSPSNPSQSVVDVIGDAYAFVTTVHPSATPPSNQSHLPLRVKEDLAYRNRFSNPKQRTSYWKFVGAHKLPLTDIKGRWYESRTLLPFISDPTEMARMATAGDIKDVGVYLNARGDSKLQQRTLGTRTMERMDVFGQAVPAGTRLDIPWNQLEEVRDLAVTKAPKAPREIINTNEDVIMDDPLVEFMEDDIL
jgi:hypothetical protein